MAEINYDEIKTEYISSDISFSSLARKYGCSISAISRKAKKDGWDEIKSKISKETQRNIEEQTIDVRSEIAKNCMVALKNLSIKVAEGSELIEADDINKQRQMSAIIKDLKDMGAFELISESTDSTLTVRFEVDEYGE